MELVQVLEIQGKDTKTLSPPVRVKLKERIDDYR
jgi:hypothetical protein